MNDHQIVGAPAVLEDIHRETKAVGFAMTSEAKTGSLLRSLAASKPKGNFLELGTGTGVGTAWLLAGMDPDSRLVTVDIDPNVVQIARRHLGHDPRVTFQVMDGAGSWKGRHLTNSISFTPTLDLASSRIWTLRCPC